MSTAPLPTRLTFLSDLPTIPPGEKVRFLGCVTHYSTVTGTITLQHAYSSTSVPQTICPTATVDVNLLLSALKSTDTQVGEWVNVLGYVQGLVDNDGAIRRVVGRVGAGLRDMNKHKVERQIGIVGVQAVMLWSAGGVRLADYEKAVEMRKKIETGSERSSV
ncbi:MAG: hypothetical protein Q9184_001041 [Pyrenodesmia sp. 2 TL-2023]